MHRQLARAMTASAVALAAVGVVPASAATRYGTRTLHQGMHGSDVKTMQRYLTRLRIRTSADGAFGPTTKRHAKTFERRYHQTVNGVLSKKELRILKSAALGTSTDAASPDPGPTTTTSSTAPQGKARLNRDGTATAPSDAPLAIKKLIAAGNRIAFKPYRYGGGHGTWNDSGYDCSGSVSYVLHAAGMLSTSRDSTGLESWGRSGHGRWLSIFANSGHAYLRVAGLRFDTSGLSADGTRWHTSARSDSGYVVRHAAGY